MITALLILLAYLILAPTVGLFVIVLLQGMRK
jgi:hypothetical protein